MSDLPARRIVKIHRDFWRWTAMVTKEAPVPDGHLYQHGSGHHPEWRVSWWRR